MIKPLQKLQPIRIAFTIVELLVSLALIIFIMSLVSTIFVLATKTFRELKAAGDLSEQLRSVGQVIRKTLQATHIQKNSNKFSLSDDNLWTPLDPTKKDDISGYTDRVGFFRFEQFQNSDEPDPKKIPDDLNFPAIKVYSAGAKSDHRLSMTCMLPGNSPKSFFSCLLPPNFYAVYPSANQEKDNRFEDPALGILNQQNAEIAFFLAAPEPGDPTKTGLLSSDPAPLDLYTLHLRTWLLSSKDEAQKDLTQPYPNPPNDPPIVAPSDRPMYMYSSANQKDLELLSGSAIAGGDPLENNYVFNNPAKVSSFANRASSRFFKNTTTRFTKNPHTPSIILRNVVSFEVRLLRAPTISQNFDDFNESLAGPYFFDTDITQQKVSDSSQKITAPMDKGSGVTFSAIKITIRVYDPDNEITRQMTIIEPL